MLAERRLVGAVSLPRGSRRLVAARGEGPRARHPRRRLASLGLFQFNGMGRGRDTRNRAPACPPRIEPWRHRRAVGRRRFRDREHRRTLKLGDGLTSGHALILPDAA